MKKIFLLVILMVISICTFGCTGNPLTSAEKMDDIVVKLLKTKIYDNRDLNEHEKELIVNFQRKELEENKIVNLSRLSALAYDAEVEDSEGVYEEDGIYYIKYTDIVWEEINESETSDEYIYFSTVIYFNNKVLNINKDTIPIIYDDTVNSSKYVYTYRGTATYSDAIISYYNSVYDDTGMRIIFSLDNKKITDIDMEFDVSTDIYEVKSNTAVKDGGTVFAIIVIVIAAVFGIFKVLKKVTLFTKY